MKLTCMAATLLFSHVALAASFPAESLTPYGATLQGNADGSIPEWNGGLTPDQFRTKDFGLSNPFAEDQPLFVIDAKNAEQYAQQLSAGQLALLKTYSDSYRIPVYPSRRSAAAPQWVYDNTAHNARTARVSNDGNGIEDAMGGIPFPIPENDDGSVNPYKVLWNHLTRWRGISLTLLSSDTPVQIDGSYTLITTRQEVSFLMYNRDKQFKDIDNKLAYLIATITSPARLAGGAALVHETLDRVKEERSSWIYDKGSRRVRKAPTLAYDTPIVATDGLLTADNVDMFNGAPDRYHWRFFGKQEMLIPYNNYALSKATANPQDLLQKGHINPDLARYELHRVWIIEATLKDGMRNIYGKRRFYLDEDTWSIVQSDLYDSRGELWRVQLAYPINNYDVPVVLPVLTAMHDLQSRRYFASFLDNAEGRAVHFEDAPPADSHFTQQSLRRLGK